MVAWRILGREPGHLYHIVGVTEGEAVFLREKVLFLCSQSWEQIAVGRGQYTGTLQEGLWSALPYL